MKTGIRGVTVSAGAVLVLLALGGVYFLFFHRLADRDLWSSHEARAGMDARSILEDGRPMPRLFDDQFELQKPPLYYWLVALTGWVRGGVVDAWSVRLPATLAGLGCLGLLVLLGWQRGRTDLGVLAAAVLAAVAHFTWVARIGRIDIPLTLMVSSAIVGFYLARASGGRGWLLLAYLSLAAGVLLKGPIGLVLPVAVTLVHLAMQAWSEEGRFLAGLALVGRRCWRDLECWWGLPLVALVVAPCLWWLDAETGGQFSRVFLWHHNLERGLGGSRLRGHPWWFYGPQFAGAFLPWTPLLLAALFLWCRRPPWRRDPEAQLGLVWLVTVVVLLSCARFKRADYLLPAYPGAALFLAGTLGRGLRRSVPAAVVLLLLASCGWLVYLHGVLPREEPAREHWSFAREIRRQVPAPEPVLFFRTEAHPLAFHVGRPLEILIQWPQLQARLARPGTYVVMPPRVYDLCLRELPDVRLVQMACNDALAGGRHEHPLLLLRSEGPPTAR
jgi:4-amino-4-deoxy-L-arabinose transferase-like glycosyltransferase